jgi:adenosine deaminase CECR1
MPKGALLHAHLDATVDMAFLLRLALQHPAMHVRASQRITEASIKSITPQFQPLPPAQFNAIGNLTDEGYQPDQWVCFKVARDSFPTQLGGPEGFDRWVLGALTINPIEAYNTHNTVYKVL